MASCIVSGCPGSAFLHEFPRSLGMIKVWLHQCRQDFGDLDVFSQRVLATTRTGLYRMCSRHFSPDCYTHSAGSLKILREDSVPTIFAPLSGSMASCIVTGCPGIPLLHEFPRNLGMIKVWLQQSRQDFGDLDAFAGRVFAAAHSGLYRMCSRHFSPECYTYRAGPMKILREDAVPTIFPSPLTLEPIKVQLKEEESSAGASPSPVGVAAGLSDRFTLPRPPTSMQCNRQCDTNASPEVKEEEASGEATLRCFVSGCRNSAEDQPLGRGAVLHAFPVEVGGVKLWLQQSGQRLGNLDLFAAHVLSNWRSFRICSDHFSSDSYLSGGGGARTRLRIDATPTIFPTGGKPVKVEEDQGRPLLAGCDREGLEACLDEMRGMRHVGTSFDPTWGVRSVGVLTRPLLMKDAATATRSARKEKYVTLPKCTAEKGVQCPAPDGDKRHTRADYYSRTASSLPPEGATEPSFSHNFILNGAPRWGYESHDQAPPNGSKLFLALEETLVSLVQHLLSSSFIEESAKLTTQSLLRQTLHIVCLLTGDKWMVAEKEEAFENLDEMALDCRDIENRLLPAPQIPRDLPQSPDLLCSLDCEGREMALFSQVPVKCGDFGVYFSPDEWDYVESHKNTYVDILPEDPPLLPEDPPLLPEDPLLLPEDPLLTEAQPGSTSGESESEEEARSAGEKSPEWRPQSAPSESEMSTDDKANDSEDSVKDLVLSHPDLKVEHSEDGKIRSFYCMKCEVSLKDKNSFRSHLMTLKHLNYRADQEEVTCDHCGQLFSSRSALTKHRAETHATKRYACTICGLEYEYISQFIIHQRAHSDEKPFECEHCGKSYSHRCSLLVHLRRHAKKTVQCSKCDKLFYTKSDLSKHARVHAPKKPLTCLICGKQFARKPLLSKHLLKHDVAKRDPRVSEESVAPDSPPGGAATGSPPGGPATGLSPGGAAPGLPLGGAAPDTPPGGVQQETAAVQEKDDSSDGSEDI